MKDHLGAVFAYNSTPVATGCNGGGRQRFNKQHVCSQHAELSVIWQVVPGTHQIKWYEKGSQRGSAKGTRPQPKVAKGTAAATE